jgi:hypothetical protein
MMNLERLHKVSNGELVGRRVGKTTLDCYSVVGTLDVTEDGDIYCLSKLIKDIDRLIQMLVPILNRCGYSIADVKHRKHVIILHNGRVLRFIKNRPENLLGVNDGYYVDFVDY